MTDWLIDKSALVRLGASPEAAELGQPDRARTGPDHHSDPARGRLLRPVRGDLRTGLRQPPVSAMPVEYLTPVIEDRAVEVLTLLPDRGQYRAPSVPDLIIAAELAGVTGQPAKWLIAN